VLLHGTADHGGNGDALQRCDPLGAPLRTNDQPHTVPRRAPYRMTPLRQLGFTYCLQASSFASTYHASAKYPLKGSETHGHTRYEA